MDRREMLMLGGASVLAPWPALGEARSGRGSLGIASAVVGSTADVDGASGIVRWRSGVVGGRGAACDRVVIRSLGGETSAGSEVVVEAVMGRGLSEASFVLWHARDGMNLSSPIGLPANGELALRVTVRRGGEPAVSRVTVPTDRACVVAIPSRSDARLPVWRRCVSDAAERAALLDTFHDPLRPGDAAPGCLLLGVGPEVVSEDESKSIEGEEPLVGHVVGKEI